jgi:hypothetical protein
MPRLLLLVLALAMAVIAMFTPWHWAIFIALLCALFFGDRDLRGQVSPYYPLALVLLFMCLAPWSSAMAASLVPDSPAIVDFSTLANTAIELVFAAIAGVAVTVAKRGIALLQSIHIMNASQIHLTSIDDLATSAAQWCAAQLEAIVDPQLKIGMKSAILAKGAQMVVDQAPTAVAATGITPAGVKAAIELKLRSAAPAVTEAPPALAA